jgi:ABC-type transport system involved in multi-copper enzyme maturation permease subunit
MNLPSATLAIARQTLRLLLQNRLLLVIVIVEVAAALLILAGGSRLLPQASNHDLFVVLGYHLLLNVLGPWTTMYFGVHAIHGEIEDRTFQYLFLRPVPRAAILLGKWLAVSLVGVAVLLLGVLLLWLAIAPRHGAADEAAEFAVAVVFAQASIGAAVAYAAAAALFAARCRWPLLWTAAFIVGLQYFVGNLPPQASLRSLTVIDPVRRIVYMGIEPTGRLARALWPADRDARVEDYGTPWLNLGILIAVCLGLALLGYCRSEYDSRQRE